ncbi:MAG: type III-A CRISPR-associated RAMP protein Csm5 [Desulfosarcina sp.]|nr:type III-A CRISPR-associated RAMP protein Csm5 [Desulfosarcina sp.]MBC2744359.1 type III-A CRISPR-associated RAMP protein Csm5 [Desulfosarcina sp.]MBC2767268.1 type III-A CRISPR-associated RAMP protein Csm5 [Desulfosarcina sp.]
MTRVSSIRQTFLCMVETISPLHIGNGEMLQKGIDFFQDGKSIQVLHRQRLFQEVEKLNKIGIAAFSNAVEEGTLADWIKSNGLQTKVKAYSAPCENNRGPNTIAVQLRDGFGRPIVPGSSLKGSMRTAILWKFASENINSRLLQNEIEYYSKKPPRNSKFADQNLCRKIFGKTPNENLMRTLTVGDVTFEHSALELQTVWVDRMVTAKQMLPKFPLFVESVQTGIQAKGQLSFDLYLTEAEQQNKCFNFKMCLGLSVLLKALRDRTAETIDHEINFFQQLKGHNCLRILDFYRNLQEQLRTLADNQTLFQLGWGSGWRGMTGALLTQEDFKQNNFVLRKNLKLAPNHLNFPFPKSRKVASKSDRGVPMGWIMLTLTPMDEVRRQEVERHQELRRKERVRQAEKAAEAHRQAELDDLPKEERQVFLLERGELQEKEVVTLYNQLDSMDAQLQLRTAKALKTYWQQVGKWRKKKMGKKQLAKVNKIKAILEKE